MSLQTASRSHQKADARVVCFCSPQKVSHLEPVLPKAPSPLSYHIFDILAFMMSIRIGYFCSLFRYSPSYHDSSSAEPSGLRNLSNKTLVLFPTSCTKHKIGDCRSSQTSSLSASARPRCLIALP